MARGYFWIVGLALLVHAGSAVAATEPGQPPPPEVSLLQTIAATTGVTQSDQWAERIKTAESIGALGSDLFGDSTNYYNGQTTFSVTDIASAACTGE